MKNKVCGSKDTCMRMNVGRRDVACARKNGMKNKVCGPEGCLHESAAGSTGRGMRNKVCGPKNTCMRMNVSRRDVESWYEMTWYEPGSSGPKNLIFHTTSR